MRGNSPAARAPTTKPVVFCVRSFNCARCSRFCINRSVPGEWAPFDPRAFGIVTRQMNDFKTVRR